MQTFRGERGKLDGFAETNMTSLTEVVCNRSCVPVMFTRRYIIDYDIGAILIELLESQT